MAIPIIDTHMHIWDLDKIRYAWLEGNTSILAQNYLPAQLYPSIEKVGVTKAILVQAANTIEDTEFMLAAAEKNEWIIGVVGWLPLQDPVQTQQLLEKKLLTNSYFKGVRHLIHDEPDENWLLQSSVIESLKILAAHDIPYDIVGVKPTHIKAALTIAEKIPDLKLVFDHLNIPPISTKQKFGEWGTLMKESALFPNMHAKISGLGTASGNFETWTVDDIQPYVEFALDHFGAEKCFCGGDWPVSLLAGSYEKAISAYRTIIEQYLSAQDQEKVFNKNATQFYHLA